ncbi:ABC transporter permease subunit [Streptomyces sp. DSM 44915]|uniref:ABC transporter permease subunit n=1 Tax=Streptomyces chisholmiae TaxID=3075540 RepID=A0ABU2JX85_9ACTN|nr:ABC transporter permease subunit [Streptomyces sp. DSM 44915]MDT0269134.1 ABC transporter permease subunit [Streptomyces sp. DSM 44915]
MSAHLGPPAALRRLARGVLVLAASAAAILVGWLLFLATVDVSPYVAKSPLDVWRHLAVAENRAVLWPLLGRTLADAGLGFVCGLAMAATVATLFAFSRPLEQMFLPTLTTLRAIPMVTLAPIIVLALGRGPAATALIGAAIVFVPALLTMLQGLRSASRTDLDVCRAFGGSAWQTYLKVTLPHAVPTWFTAARITVTTSIVGALLAEWLASGAGLGGQMMRDANEFQFARLWASVVVLTVVCVAIYQLIALVERAVRTRLAAPG